EPVRRVREVVVVVGQVVAVRFLHVGAQGPRVARGRVELDPDGLQLFAQGGHRLLHLGIARRVREGQTDVPHALPGGLLYQTGGEVAVVGVETVLLVPATQGGVAGPGAGRVRAVDRLVDPALEGAAETLVEDLLAV